MTKNDRKITKNSPKAKNDQNGPKTALQAENGQIYPKKRAKRGPKLTKNDSKNQNGQK